MEEIVSRHMLSMLLRQEHTDQPLPDRFTTAFRCYTASVFSTPILSTTKVCYSFRRAPNFTWKSGVDLISHNWRVARQLEGCATRPIELPVLPETRKLTIPNDKDGLVNSKDIKIYSRLLW